MTKIPYLYEEVTDIIHKLGVHTHKDGEWIYNIESNVIGPIIGTNRRYFIMIPTGSGYSGGGPDKEWNVPGKYIRGITEDDWYNRDVLAVSDCFDLDYNNVSVNEDFHLGDRCLVKDTPLITTVVDPEIYGMIRESRILVRHPNGLKKHIEPEKLINLSKGKGTSDQRFLLIGTDCPKEESGQLLFW